MALTHFLLLIAIYFICRGALYLLGIKKSINFLVGPDRKKKKSVNRVESYPEVIILLPLLREQSVIKEMIDYFAEIHYPKDKISIILITSERENYEKEQNRKKLKDLYKSLQKRKSLTDIKEKYLGIFSRNKLEEITRGFAKGKINLLSLYRQYDSLPTTDVLAKELAKAKNKNLNSTMFFHTHYPKTKGIMAHQLNYAIDNLNKILNKEVSKKNTYIGVYNADSKPNKNTLTVLGKNATDYKATKGEYPPVFQQISAYLHNYFSYSATLKGSFLKASSLAQTRWALGSEIPMLIRQSNFWERKKNKKMSLLEEIFEPAAYCVGH